MSEHFKTFTRHLIDEREGAPVSVGTAVAVFTNLGNLLPGNDAEDQRAKARVILDTDEGLAFNKHDDTYDTPNDGETPEQFARRRELQGDPEPEVDA